MDMWKSQAILASRRGSGQADGKVGRGAQVGWQARLSVAEQNFNLKDYRKPVFAILING